MWLIKKLQDNKVSEEYLDYNEVLTLMNFHVENFSEEYLDYNEVLELVHFHHAVVYWNEFPCRKYVVIPTKGTILYFIEGGSLSRHKRRFCL